jgi:hypothetical protein
VKMGGPEVERAFFGDSVQIFEVMIRWHRRTPVLGSSQQCLLFILSPFLMGIPNLGYASRWVHLGFVYTPCLSASYITLPFA